ncbi:MAG TPA: hypothetical protein VJN02_11555 [Gammaproteobacteria bacterium]|nr:hypothetical protein [Gammaproteobacteria bacterium]
MTASRSSSTSHAMRKLTSTPTAAPLSWQTLKWLMVFINYGVFIFLLDYFRLADAQNIDRLWFNTTNSSTTADSLTTFFLLETFQSAAGQGNANSPLFILMKNAIKNSICNSSLADEKPYDWILEKQWNSYPQASLYAASQNKNHTDQISCVTNLIDNLRALEDKTMSYLLPVLLTLLLLAIFGTLTYTIVASKTSYKHGPAIDKFRNWVQKNKPSDENNILLENEENAEEMISYTPKV